MHPFSYGSRASGLRRVKDDRPQSSRDSVDELELLELNRCLAILVEIFPHILPVVFREMLLQFEGESRLDLVVESLLKHQVQWVKGRWRPSEGPQNPSHPSMLGRDQFRRNSYKWASKVAIHKEFNTFSQKTINAALEEQNYCYTLTRPILQRMTTKSWKCNLNLRRLFSKSKSAKGKLEDHFMLRWSKLQVGTCVPILRDTGDEELDQELRETVLKPLLDQNRKSQEAADWITALQMNRQEAEQAGAMFECECCFSDTSFEQMTTCHSLVHVICFSCLRKAVHEALFGQSWACNVDPVQGLLRCIAINTDVGCQGLISQPALQRAMLEDHSGSGLWFLFEARVTEESLVQANLPLLRCPFCSYVEIADESLMAMAEKSRFTTNLSPQSVFLALRLLTLLVFFVIYSRFYRFLPVQHQQSPSSRVKASLMCLSFGNPGPRQFRCRSPRCLTISCLVCSKPWRDPHICNESESQALCTAVEAAQSAALKRTCPNCRLNFIKDSGCNKLTCVCGYKMCYICRQGLKDGGVEGGYRHFCQHFRPLGGKCQDCKRCDLYQRENEDEVMIAAAQKAEREFWENKRILITGKINAKVMTAKKPIPFDWNKTLEAVLGWLIQQILKQINSTFRK